MYWWRTHLEYPAQKILVHVRIQWRGVRIKYRYTTSWSSWNYRHWSVKCEYLTISICELTQCCHILLAEKLAHARDCLSLVVLSSRVAYMGIIRRKFPRLFLSPSLSSCSALRRPQIVYSCLSIPVLFACSSAFSHIFFIHIVAKTSFSSLSLFFSPPEIMRFYSLHRAAERANDRRRKKRRREKLSLLSPSSALYAFISIVFSPDVTKKTNSCEKDANRR